MKPGKYNLLFNVASALLTLTSLAKILALAGHAKILEMQDPLLQLGYRQLLILVALVEVGVAVFLLKSPSDLERGLTLMWLSSNFLFYHLGNYFLNIHLCPCLGAIDDNLPLPKGMGEVIVQVLALYWFITTLNMLWREWWSAGWDRAVSAVRRFIFGASATGANRA
jgi:hypothetical protein